ncbi:DUF4157 domain-containing protein [Streptomyces sp. NPDC004539]|uniref:eCIS core domain-containing protein n=1 Tax=Streptomyces sp. NPDC004539 TaxID=3154280 RepID=UPI0033B2A48E
MVQRRRDDADADERPGGPPVQRSTVPDVLRSAGRPLAGPVRAEMEQRLGTDFSDVRVHEGVAAQRSAAEVGARAYTSGHHVVIGDGGGDRHTLAHELVHVVQQRSGPVPGTDDGSGLSVSDPSDRFEREAEATARRVMSGPVATAAAPDGAVRRARGTAVQRMTNEEADGAPAPAPVDPLTAFAAATYTPGPGGTVGEVADGPRAATLRQIAWAEHWAPIAAVCQKYHYTIAVRETGEYSIKRIAEGAKPKPHTILEKSIKPGSVKKEYGAGSKRPDTNLDEVLAWLAQEDLDGFVGHWGDAGLEGLRIDDPPQSVLDLGIVQTGPDDEQYVPITLLEDGGGGALATLKTAVPNWKTLLYTGDYDLHEAYSWMGAGAGGGQIAEASDAKVHLLNRLNAGVANSSDTPVKREGKSVKGAHGLHMEDSPYAMFQHGDQATYRMNQVLEAEATGMKPVVAKLVKAVATESDEPMGWCRWGQWYVTMDKTEHAALRKKWGLVTPNTWSDEDVRRTEENGYKTAKYR